MQLLTPTDAQISLQTPHAYHDVSIQTATYTDEYTPGIGGPQFDFRQARRSLYGTPFEVACQGQDKEVLHGKGHTKSFVSVNVLRNPHSFRTRFEKILRPPRESRQRILVQSVSTREPRHPACARHEERETYARFTQ